MRTGCERLVFTQVPDSTSSFPSFHLSAVAKLAWLGFHLSCLCVFYRHAQALAALQAYCHWLAHFYSEVHSQNQSQFINLITSAIDASSPLITAKVDRPMFEGAALVTWVFFFFLVIRSTFLGVICSDSFLTSVYRLTPRLIICLAWNVRFKQDCASKPYFVIFIQVPEKLLLSSCHLLVSITSTVRPVFLVTLTAVQNIFNLITTEGQSHRLPQEVEVYISGIKLHQSYSPISLFWSVCRLLQAHILVCRALSNMLLLPWPNLPENEQQWQTRSTSHGSLVAALTREYRLLRGTVNIPPRQTDLNSSQ